MLADFTEYNDFLEVCDSAVAELDLEGELQVASFHPQYQFAESQPDDIENFTNRSPYPMLHLLREASVERAVDAVGDPEEIYRRNIRTLRALGMPVGSAYGATSGLRMGMNSMLSPRPHVEAYPAVRRRNPAPRTVWRPAASP